MKKIYYKYPNNVDTHNAGIEIRFANELSNTEIINLKRSGLDEYNVPFEAWTALGSNFQINYSTHGIFRYYGKFPSTIAAHLIMQYTKESDNVMDPMSGSGTTAVECLLSNRKCKAFDVNPLSILLAKVKTTHIDRSILEEHLEIICHKYKPLTIDKFDWEPVGIRNLDHWFYKETQDSIRGIIYLIENISDESIKNFFWICLLSSIRPVSKATTQQGRLFLDISTAKKDALDTFKKKSIKAIKSVSELPVDHAANIMIDEHDSSKSFNFTNINDLIIVHPPYFNSYKYSAINSLELGWMRANRKNIRKNEVREFFKVGKSENASIYINDMRMTLNNIIKTLKSNGIMALMIGDTVIKGDYLRVTDQIIKNFLADNPNVSIEKIVLRIPKYTEASWSTSQRRKSNQVGININDYIIVFKKNCC